MEKYPIGFWNLCEFELPEIWKRPREIVQEWDEAGMTLAMSPMYSEFPGSREAMFELLDEAARRDIHVMFYDLRLKKAWFPDRFDEDRVRSAALQLRNDFGLHPAVDSIFILDEPGCMRGLIEVKNTIKVSQIVSEVIPEKKMFVNFAPWSFGWGPERLGQGGRKYQDVLTDIVNDAHLGLTGYDCYTQLLPDGEGLTEYFHNLEVFRDMSLRTGVPFLNTVLMTGHFRYREVTENDFRWQLYTSIAHGADGIMGYFFYNRRMTGRYGLAPIDEHYERSSQFEKVARINRTFHKTYGSLIPKLKLEKVWHAKKSFANYPLFCEEEDENLIYVEAAHEAIVSRFRHQDGTLYYSITNNSQTEANQCYLYFRKGLNVIDVCGLQWEEVPEAEYHMGTTPAGEGIKAGWWHEPHYAGNWLSPGSMKIWKVLPNH